MGSRGLPVPVHAWQAFRVRAVRVNTGNKAKKLATLEIVITLFKARASLYPIPPGY